MLFSHFLIWQLLLDWTLHFTSRGKKIKLNITSDISQAARHWHGLLFGNQVHLLKVNVYFIVDRIVGWHDDMSVKQ